MKKILSFLIAAAVLFGVCSCGMNGGGAHAGFSPKDENDTLLKSFYDMAESGDENLSAKKIAESVASTKKFPLNLSVFEQEAGWLAGFNEEIGGFVSCAKFAPMIGAQPFVGYIFELEKGSDVKSFIEKLDSAADLRWNICTSADKKVSDSVGVYVFYMLCPSKY
ncbi:MAG: hypothetical protein KBS59_06730 [Clostridiales bacterium]|nr:hypothetical protein [Clostridiales bacterium]